MSTTEERKEIHQVFNLEMEKEAKSMIELLQKVWTADTPTKRNTAYDKWRERAWLRLPLITAAFEMFQLVHNTLHAPEGEAPADLREFCRIIMNHTRTAVTDLGVIPEELWQLFSEDVPEEINDVHVKQFNTWARLFDFDETTLDEVTAAYVAKKRKEEREENEKEGQRRSDNEAVVNAASAA